MPTSAETPRITIAICTRNRAGFLEKALQSLIPQMHPRDELLIIDNASTDRTPELAAQTAAHDSRIKVYREERLGLSAGRNAAHRLARTEFVLFLDDDAVVKPGWIDAYVDFIERHKGEKIGCIGGACIPDYEAPPPAWHNPKSDRYDLGDKELEVSTKFRLPGGGNCAYNTKAVIEAGWFCNDLRRAEDTDIHHLFQRAGYQIWWLPNAPIYHYMSRERLRFWRQAKAAFFEGRAVARVRLRQRTSALSRELYRVSRLLTSPFYMLWSFLVALITIPIVPGRVAARSFQRGLRVAGMFWQMTADLLARRFSYS